MKMFLAGQWADKSQKIEVKNPYDGSVVDTVPKADAADVDKRLAGAVEGAKLMRAMPAYQGYKILNRALQPTHDANRNWPKRSRSKKANRFANRWLKPRGVPKPWNFRPRRPVSSTPRCCRWMRPRTVR